MRVVLATRNDHKLRELAELLRGVRLEPLPADVELPPETGTTFADNALVKARVAATSTGLPAIADDSGIEAAALGGAPGVWSARYAGEDATDEENLAKLLREVPDEDRRVSYVCALAYVEPGGREEVVHGRCDGHAERRAARRRRLRLRPGLRAGGLERRPHDGRAVQRARRTRSATAAAPHGRSLRKLATSRPTTPSPSGDDPPQAARSDAGRPRSRTAGRRRGGHRARRGTGRADAPQGPRGGGLDRLERAPDRAQARRGGDHRARSRSSPRRSTRAST